MLTIEDRMKLAEKDGTVLAGRSRAIELREQLQREFADTGVVVLDFAGVEAMSPSFADELFGRFVDEVGEDRVRFENLNPHLESVSKIVRRHARRTTP